MTEYNFRIAKGRDGWAAETRIKLDDHGLPGRVLELSTYKSSRGGVWTHAQCLKLEGGFVTFVIFQDFSKTVQQDRKARCTEKTVETMHQAALAQADAIVAECVAAYTQKEAA